MQSAIGGIDRAKGLRIGVVLTLTFLAWVSGIALQLQQARLWPSSINLLLCAIGLTGWALTSRWRRLWPLAVIATIALAFGWAGWRASLRLADALPMALEGETILVTGVIASLPNVSPDGTRFFLDVEAADMAGHAVKLPHLISLGWYRGFHDEATLDDPRARLGAGQRWRMAVRLKRPHGGMNPGGFDQELWLFEQGVRASGYVRSTAAQPAQHLSDAAGYPVERLRQAVRDAIFQRVADARSAGVLAALAVGDQSGIERDDWDLFRAGGISHLVAISGLHVTMFSWLASVVIGWAWRRNERLMLWIPAPSAARWGGVASAALYSLLSGWGIASQRTVWMLATSAALGSLGLRWPWALVLLAAATVVTFIDPWALLQVGFWLSFAAVGLLMSSGPAHAPEVPVELPLQRGRRLLKSIGHALRELARTQGIATLGLAPLTLVFFQQLSLVGYLANLVAIPLVTLVITPLSLLGLLFPPLWTLGGLAVKGLASFLSVLTSLPGAVWMVPQAPAWAVASGLFGGAVLMLPLPWRWRVLSGPLMLPLIWPAVTQPAAGGFDLLAADVGQGTSVVVRTHAHLLVYDTGPQYSPDSDAGQRVLLPLLHVRGDGPVDLLMLSHADLDHVGGAAALIRNWPVKAMSSSLPAGHRLLQMGVPHTPCSAGQRWEWDGVRFAVLQPRAEALRPDAAGKPPKTNSVSCVLRIVDTVGHSALLTGDAEAPQEAQMVAADAAALRSEVMTAPHHGSHTSSTPAFLDAIQPRIAIVQAGYRNHFGHPAPDVMARYAARGIQVVRSDQCGAWTWEPALPPDDEAWPKAEHKLSFHCERDLVRRYWHFVALE